MAIFAFAIQVSSIAQAPQSFKYQTVVRDATGEPVANQPVNFRLSILMGSTTGSTEYVETNAVTTNAHGLATLTIGTGTIVSGIFSEIDWGADSYFLQVETDITGGSSFQLMGVTQLMSVPYALYSEKTGDNTRWLKNGDNLYYDNGKIGIGTDAPASLLDIVTPSLRAQAASANYALYGEHSLSGSYGYLGGSNIGGFGNGSIYGLQGSTVNGYALYGSASGTGYGGYFEGKGYFSGKVGIGTSTLNNWLNIKVPDSDDAFISVERFTGKHGGISWLETGTTEAQWIFPYFRGWQSDNLIVREEVANLDVMTFEFGTGDIGIGTNTPEVPLHIDGGSDASLSSGGYLQINGSNTYNMVMDDNEILARNNGAASTLHLNTNGGKVSIGTTSPTSTLHVEGSFHAQGNITTGSKVGYLSIPAAAFTPWNNNMVYTNYGNYLINQAAYTDVFMCPVYLPDSVEVTFIYMYFVDNSTTDDIHIYFRYTDLASGTATNIKNIQSGSVTSPNYQSYNDYLSHVVSNATKSYMITVHLPPNSGNDVQFYGIRLVYSYDKIKM